MSFENQIMGIINSSKTGPEKFGIICANPLIVNFDQTVKDILEMREFVDLDTFNRVLVKIQQRLAERGRGDISDKLKEKLNG